MRVHQDANKVNCVAIGYVRGWIIYEQVCVAGFQKRPIFGEELHADKLADRAALVERIDGIFEAGNPCPIQAHLKM